MLLLEDHSKQQGNCESLRGNKAVQEAPVGPRTGVLALTRARRKHADMNMTTRRQERAIVNGKSTSFSWEGSTPGLVPARRGGGVWSQAEAGPGFTSCLGALRGLSCACWFSSLNLFPHLQVSVSHPQVYVRMPARNHGKACIPTPTGAKKAAPLPSPTDRAHTGRQEDLWPQISVL